MEPKETQDTGTRKNVVSIIVLLGALLLLMYAAPVLNEKLREWSEKEKAEEVEQDQGVEQKAQPQVSEELADWLPLVREQLAKAEDVSSKYSIRHMRLSEDKSQLLLDLREGEEGEAFDLILQRDQFGRYTSDHPNIQIKLYPPEK